MNDRSNTIEWSQVHATFVIERSYPAPAEAVWRALSDNDARDQWFNAGSAFDADETSHDFRVGGHATEEGQWHDGPRSKFRSTYSDIVDLQRIVFTYDMWVDGRRRGLAKEDLAVAGPAPTLSTCDHSPPSSPSCASTQSE